MGTKISAMTAAAALDGTEKVPLVQGGVNVEATTADVAALGAVFGGIVGTGASPETDANAVRPTTALPVYWLMANGVTPTNAQNGDLIWNAA